MTISRNKKYLSEFGVKESIKVAKLASKQLPQDPQSQQAQKQKGEKMNGLSFSELCCLFCCPPCPGRIASKLAFLPPETTYDLKPDDESSTKYALALHERADWQFSDKEKECFETFYARSSRGNRIACLFVRCSLNARSDNCSYYYLYYLFFVDDKVSNNFIAHEIHTHIILLSAIHSDTISRQLSSRFSFIINVYSCYLFILCSNNFYAHTLVYSNMVLKRKIIN